MINIQSKDNRIIKEVKKLKNKKYRDKEGLYLVEGPNLIEEALKNGVQIQSLLISPSYKDKDFSYLDNSYLVEDELFKEISDTVNSQGILAIVAKKNFSGELKPKDNILVLDRLQDPGNMGTIIRTADAAGYGLIVSIKGSCDIYSEKVVRSAAGSLFRMPIVEGLSYEELGELVKGKHLVVSDLQASEFYYEANLKENIALVIGNEGNGISDEIRQMADMRVKLPMIGNIESLNAAVAAGILMYESIRK